MVQQQFGTAVATALRSGFDRNAIIRMVTSELENQATKDLPEEPAEVVYDVLPEGLIDLPSACERYGVNVTTANGWMRKGQITRLGKKRAPGKGGANVTSETAFVERMRRPNDVGGRPRKAA